MLLGMQWKVQPHLSASVLWQSGMLARRRRHTRSVMPTCMIITSSLKFLNCNFLWIILLLIYHTILFCFSDWIKIWCTSCSLWKWIPKETVRTEILYCKWTQSITLDLPFCITFTQRKHHAWVQFCQLVVKMSHEKSWDCHASPEVLRERMCTTYSVVTFFEVDSVMYFHCFVCHMILCL